MVQPRNLIAALEHQISRVIVGKEDAIQLALIALICRGHVLIEDVPGVGKTTLASALARSLNCSFRRIQFTPDLMPSDVTGFTMVNFKTGEMEYREGAIMSQIVLADEINRTSPRTQSALLEAMEEHQVTVDGTTHYLPQPFMVLATQNPGEFVGTYPLPEAQMDRFFLRISMGYPTIEQEMDVLERYSGVQHPMDTVQPVCNGSHIVEMQEMAVWAFFLFESVVAKHNLVLEQEILRHQCKPLFGGGLAVRRGEQDVVVAGAFDTHGDGHLLAAARRNRRAQIHNLDVRVAFLVFLDGMEGIFIAGAVVDNDYFEKTVLLLKKIGESLQYLGGIVTHHNDHGNRNVTES